MTVLATTESVALVGTEGHLVKVEVYVAPNGLPTFRVVGLPNVSVREADQRIRSAIESSAHDWPRRRVVANLAPAGLRKEGTHFDLALGLGLMAGAELMKGDLLDGWVFVGELGLDGSIRPIRGTLAAALACKEAGRKGIVCPVANAPEAAIVEGIEVVPVEDLARCVAFLEGRWTPGDLPVIESVEPACEDMSEVKGHPAAKLAAEVAAAGGHNLLMIGPPGSGKSMIARRLPGILPRMSQDESLEVTTIYSVAGLLGGAAGLIAERPFRSPHQGISLAGLVGGGTGLARPGEASLAHHGVLFLDEISLFRRDVLDSLRAPIEEGVVRIARSQGVISFPCRLSLVAAMNPCPCGYAMDPGARCSCSAVRLRTYNEKLSGPLIDRFDIQAILHRPSRAQLMDTAASESSTSIRARVEAARHIQQERFGSTLVTNSSCSKAELEDTVSMTAAARNVLAELIDSARLTGRGMDRIKRLARTLADLAGDEWVDAEHVYAAGGYRFLDREAVPA